MIVTGGILMDKANIIISIIIVLCIAAAVAAYGITNSNNPIFSDLSSMGANDNDDNGLGNITANNQSSVATTTGSTGSADSGSGSGSTSSGSSSGSSSSSSNSGSSSNGGGSNSNNNGGSSQGTQLSYSAAKAIASDAILEEGCYAGDGYYSNGYWIFNVYDADGNVVDSIGVNDATGMTERV